MDSIKLHKHYIANILYIFTQMNAHKVAIDAGNKVLNLYRDVAASNEFISGWLSLMSHEPSNYETIEINIEEHESELNIFLLVCSATAKQNKMIVYSHQALSEFAIVQNTLNYRGKDIIVLDRDDAVEELKPVKNVTYVSLTNSVGAFDGSTIQDTRNEVE
ncbi:hypothetical protein [Leptospira noguchii]|uniref:hypothetical protein n=1 Tax=Leptospira noguchii TaxID=28182 RepID=UPI001A94950E|nr:hypothetical protein [Leptospira noguchii]